MTGASTAGIGVNPRSKDWGFSVGLENIARNKNRVLAYPDH